MGRRIVDTRKTKNLIQVAEVKFKVTGEADTEQKTEVLSGGFVFEYPYIKDGVRQAPLNMSKAADQIVKAVTPEETKLAARLYQEVVERETAIVMEQVKKILSKKIEDRKSKI